MKFIDTSISMPNQIKQEPSPFLKRNIRSSKKYMNIQHTPEPSTIANANPRMVPEEEHNKLKRKLEQSKRKLDKTEEELQKNKKKSKQLKALVATDVQFRPRRERIRLTWPNFAKSAGLLVVSKPVEIAGFQWKLSAERISNGTLLGLFLRAYPPADYKGPFEAEVDCTFRLLNTFSSKDIHRKVNNKTIRALPYHRYAFAGVIDMAEIKTILDQKNGFLRGDGNGSVQVEADFTVKTATLDHFLVDDPVENATAGNNAGSSTD